MKAALLVALAAMLLVACAVDVTSDGGALPECSDEHDPCAEIYGEGFVCCAGACVADDPVDCDEEDR